MNIKLTVFLFVSSGYKSLPPYSRSDYS